MDDNQQPTTTTSTTTVCVDGAAADASRADSTSMPEVVGTTPAQLAAAVAAIIAAIPSTTAVAVAAPNASAPAAAVTSKKKGKKRASKKNKAADESGEEVAAKKTKGCNFDDEEVFNFLEHVEKEQPLSLTEWGVVAAKHAVRFGARERDGESLRRKFNLLANKRMPTGDPNIPWDVKEAKRIRWQMAGTAGLKTGSPNKAVNMTSVNTNGGAFDDDSDTDDEDPVDFTRGPYDVDDESSDEENNEDDFDGGDVATRLARKTLKESVKKGSSTSTTATKKLVTPSVSVSKAFTNNVFNRKQQSNKNKATNKAQGVDEDDNNMKCFMQMFMMQCESEREERRLQAAQAKTTQDMLQLLLLKTLGGSQPQPTSSALAPTAADPSSADDVSE
jgi:hypothetical protein